jgi:WD40 repeat protein
VRVIGTDGRSLFRARAGTTNLCVPALSPDRTRVAAVETRPNERTARVKIWDMTSGREQLSLDLPAPVPFETAFGGVAFSPDATRIAAAVTLSDLEERDLSISITVWDAATGQLVVDLPGRHTGFTPLAFSPDGTRIAAAGRPRPERTEVAVWDVATGREVLRLRGHMGWLDCLAFSPDGQRIASCSSDGRGAGDLRIWDARTGDPMVTIRGHDATVSAVVFSPDGRRISSAGHSPSGRNEVHFWDAETGLELLTVGTDVRGMVSLAFSPDGSRLIAAGIPFLDPRTSVRVWEGAPPGAGPPVRSHKKRS